MRDDDAKLGQRDVWYAAGLVLTAAVLLLLLSSSTSPLTLPFGWDSAYFITTGRLVLAGQTPYVDFFEMKGPLIFFLEALGQCLAPGRTGAFLLQVLFDGATAVLLYLSARLYLSRRGAAAAALFSLLFLTIMLEGGNLTEEYCLTPAALCLYLAMRQLRRGEPGGHPPACAVVYGICSGLIIWIKITHGTAVFGVVLYFTCALLYRRRYKLLLYNALAYLAGLAIVTAPLLAWFAARDALPGLLYGTFVVPFRYAGNGMAIRTAGGWVRSVGYTLPVLAAAAAALLTGAYRQPLGRLVLCCTALSEPALMLGEGYRHYAIIASPYVMLAVVMAAGKLRTLERKTTARRLTALGLGAYLTLLALLAVRSSLDYLPQVFDSGARETAAGDIQDCRRLGALIPQEERDSVLAYAGNMAASWYEMSGILPCYKYFAYDFWTRDQSACREYTQMLQDSPPAWYVVSGAALAGQWPMDRTVTDTLSARYEMVARTRSFLYLFRLRDDADALSAGNAY